MRQRYTFNYLWITIVAIAISINFAFSAVLQNATADTSYLFKARNAKKGFLKNGIAVNSLPTFKPYVVKTTPPKQQEDDKLLSNVQVFPNPVVDQINLRYTVSRNSNVTIKIMDVLGNNVATLFSQRVDPGEQKFTHYLTNKLTSGFYFVRVMVGTESVIKRITVL
ncbi:T9SS type A sorting domain-containing protein [Mucilaginibacter sp. Bleaf8]|uniref:T9SS type A sorting domain-containing protein n=1 Tax=Mucilaginibacter sp. Bleaf8 TaxID=2834430 RepID=UPI001BCF1820|nr:T9SS type A sorting domain-containing protein [Mucilaginibacter sp. Bleaf8]MBS7564542.1 T9SS type A sorting domain-containing protein [Mucilaginibacter sp. Bleaf8]